MRPSSTGLPPPNSRLTACSPPRHAGRATDGGGSISLRKHNEGFDCVPARVHDRQHMLDITGYLADDGQEINTLNSLNFAPSTLR